MNSYANPYTVAAAEPSVRAEFIKKTYMHLAGAVAAFAVLEFALLQIPGIGNVVRGMGGAAWLGIMVAWMAVSWIADKWASSETSKATQYMGLGIFIVAEAIIFLPIMYIADGLSAVTGQNLIGKAGLITLFMVAGLTFVAFTTKKDFSFLSGILKIAGFVAIGMIVASIIFPGFNLGNLFSGAMIVVASGSILYSTSNIIHHYRADQHVAASLSLFAGVALLFFYVLRIVISFASND